MSKIIELEKTIADLERTAKETELDLADEISTLRQKLEEEKQKESVHPTRWQRILLARSPGRPTSLDYVERIFDNYVELNGDRKFGNDQALIGGPATINGRSVMLLLQQKGRDTKDNIRRSFGMSNPEGYRKAMRLMQMAEKFKMPVVALIDTIGAYPGLAAEERGQAWAIAESIALMASLKVPTISVVIGEGGSGGALAIGMGNRVLMMQNAWYSVISPESCAAILWRDAKEAPKAAEALQPNAADLERLGVIEEIIPEPSGGAHIDPQGAAENLRTVLCKHLDELSSWTPEALVAQRAARFRALGVFEERE